MSLRTEFPHLALLEDSNLRELCRRLGISRKTGYKWLKRYQRAVKAVKMIEVVYQIVLLPPLPLFAGEEGWGSEGLFPVDIKRTNVLT